MYVYITVKLGMQFERMVHECACIIQLIILRIYIYDTTSIHVNQRAEIRLWSQSLLLVCDATKQASGGGWIGLD